MAKHKTILFLCTGNYYRSRFAEILFNSVAGKMGLPWKASSKGLALERGVNNVGSMAVSAVKALEALDAHAADDVARFPMQATVDDFTLAAKIVALKQAEHLPLMQERFPAWVEKVEFWHVDDAPEVLGLIEQEVMRLVARIMGGGERQVVVPDTPEPPDAKETKKPLTAKVGRETVGRRGKGVTTVFDLPLDETGIRELAACERWRHEIQRSNEDGMTSRPSGKACRMLLGVMMQPSSVRTSAVAPPLRISTKPSRKQMAATKHKKASAPSGSRSSLLFPFVRYAKQKSRTGFAKSSAIP
jgi:protein-tyrosine phosphatase